ncbi:MAG: hypothetical protein ACXU9X_08765 [Thermodesulfobacteriota bacterium]
MKRAVAQLFRLTIAMKLSLGFLSYGILTILIAFIALSSLQRLNEINNRIIARDVPVVEMSDKMVEALLAQELLDVVLSSSRVQRWRCFSGKGARNSKNSCSKWEIFQIPPTFHSLD